MTFVIQFQGNCLWLQQHGAGTIYTYELKHNIACTQVHCDTYGSYSSSWHYSIDQVFELSPMWVSILNAYYIFFWIVCVQDCCTRMKSFTWFGWEKVGQFDGI